MRQAIWIALGGIVSVLFVAGATSALFLLVGHRPARGVNVVPVVYVPSERADEPWQAGAHGERVPEQAPQPREEITRLAPTFGATVLAGCSPKDLSTLRSRLHETIELASPLYNAGDVSGSYYAYDAAAHSIAAGAASTCRGPARELEQGRAKASKRATLPEQAWAMRDTFDGLLDLIDRNGTEL